MQRRRHVGVDRRYRQVQFAAGDLVVEIVGQALRQLDPQRRTPRQQALQRRRHHAVHRRAGCADAQQPRFAHPQLHRMPHGVAIFGLELFRVALEGKPRRRQAQPAAATVQQRQARIGLQPLQ
ncbi:hypothetical protein D3C87_1578640 [compost metagenome]